MSYYAVGDPEALVACPYEKTHMIHNKRMQLTAEHQLNLVH